MKSFKINKLEAVLVVIDFQEKLMPVIKNNQDLEETMVKLIKGCMVLGVPIITTQQYTKGLGETVGPIKEAMGENFLPIEKTTFSAMGEENFVETLKKSGKKTIILTGIEAHICVQQTALDLLEEGYNVFLVNDAISSRDNSDKKYAQRRICEAGAIGTTYESVLFELLGGATEVGFKQISGIVK